MKWSWHLEWAAPGQEDHPWSEVDILHNNVYYGPHAEQVLVCRSALTADPLLVLPVQALLQDRDVARALDLVRGEPVGTRGALYAENLLIDAVLAQAKKSTGRRKGGGRLSFRGGV